MIGCFPNSLIMISKPSCLQQMWGRCVFSHINWELWSYDRKAQFSLSFSLIPRVWQMFDPRRKDWDGLGPISRDAQREKYSEPCPPLQGVSVRVVSEPRAQRNSTDSSVWVESVLSLTTQLCHITIAMVSSWTAQCYIKRRKTSAIEFYWHFFLQLYCVKFILRVGFKSCCRGDLI